MASRARPAGAPTATALVGLILASSAGAAQDPEPPAPAPTGPLELTARLLDLDGEPLEARYVTAWVAPGEGAPAFPDAEPVRVQDGAVTLVRAADQRRPDPGWWVLGVWDAETCLATVAIPLPPAGTSGALDLGVLEMVAPPLVATGVVLDEQGAGLPDARVDLSPSGAVPSRTTTDAEGRFEFRGWTHGELYVQLHDPARRAPVQRLQAGQEDVVLRCTPPDLCLRPLLPPGLSDRDLSVSAARQGEGWMQTARGHLWEGTFRIWIELDKFGPEPTSPSTGLEVDVRHRDLRRPLWSRTFAAVEPLPAELEVDLRHLLAMELEVVGPAGEPVSQATLVLSRSDPDRDLGLTYTDHGGRARLFLAEPGPVSMRVEARGFQTRALELLGPEACGEEPCLVVLEQALAVEVTALGAPALDPERWRLSVYAVSESTNQGGFCGADGLCHPGAGDLRLDLAFPAPGTWSLRWWLHHRRGPDAGWSDHLVQAPAEPFEVSAEVRAVEVTAPRAEIEAAVARLGG